MAGNRDVQSTVANFTENCTSVIDQIVSILIEGLKNIFVQSTEDVNFEYLTLIQTEYNKITDEIKNGVQLYIDCNPESFQLLTNKQLASSLRDYHEVLQNVVAVLSGNKVVPKSVSEFDEVNQEVKLKSGDTKTVHLLSFELNTVDTLELPEERDDTIDKESSDDTEVSNNNESEASSRIGEDTEGNSKSAESDGEAITDNVPASASEQNIDDADYSPGRKPRRSPRRPRLRGRKSNQHCANRNKVCLKCNKVFNSMADLVRHSISHKELQCHICKEWFRNKAKLKIHFKTHFVCSYCKKTFSTTTQFYNHVALHEKPYKCSTCGAGFETQKVLRAHENIHSGKTPFECQVCHKGFRERHLLADHMRYHKEKVSCPECEKEFTKKSNLYRHIEIKHQGVSLEGSVKKHVCPLCNAAFAYQDTYESHMRKKHPEHFEEHRPNFKCRICSVRFKSKELLDVHKQNCIAQTFECKVCSKTYNNKLLLNNHMRYHSNRNLNCPHCERKFIKSFDLKSHIMRLHDNQRPIKCEYCFKGFVTNTELKKHLVTHTGVSDFHCDICDKFFISNQVLTRHITEIHYRIANFICDLCGQKFRDARSLRNHVDRHDDNKPYKCPTCNKGFSWTTGLKRHVEVAHENKPSTQSKKSKKTSKTKMDKVEQENDLIPVMTADANQMVLYKTSAKGLSAHEVTAVEGVDLESVVYEAQQAGAEASMCEDGSAGDGLIYYQTAQGNTQEESEVQHAENEIQLIIYT